MKEGDVTTGGSTVRYRLEGPESGPVVVLLASLGTTLSLWDPQVPRLAGFARVLRLDHRGHGGSSAPPGPYSIAALGTDVVDALDGLGIERAAICGLSLGGMVGMWVAAHHPQRVTSLVLACTAPRLGPPDAWHSRAAAVRAGGTVGLLDVLYERWFPPAVREARPALRDVVSAMLADCDPEGYASCCEAIAEMDLEPDLGAITAPTLVVAGADDPVTPPSVSLSLAESVGAGLVSLRGAAHLANLSSAEEFTEALVSHVVGPPAARGMAVRRAVLGDAHVARAAARPEEAARAFSDLITRTAWGEVWTRPGLDRRTRSAVTLATLIALGRHEELGFHTPGALRNGLSPEEVVEIVLHCGVYAGVPAANSALPIVLDALEAAGEAGDLAEGPPVDR